MKRSDKKQYDIIGDIHGHAQELELLLEKMGYVKNEKGAYAHPERTAIFVGDFIDRGPENFRSVEIVKAMVDGEHAHAIIGNHEYNTIAYFTEDQENPGQYLRKRDERSNKQHEGFMKEFNSNPKKGREIIEWFKTLPVYLQIDDFQVVHATWNQQSIDKLHKLDVLDENNVIKPECWEGAMTFGEPAFEAVSSLFYGAQIDLPNGETYVGHNGHQRSDMRIAWWKEDVNEQTTMHDIALVPKDQLKKISRTPVDPKIFEPYKIDTTTFIGHYWLKGGEPTLLTSQVACVDWSVAKGEKLAAYQHTVGKELSNDNFISVEKLKEVEEGKSMRSYR